MDGDNIDEIKQEWFDNDEASWKPKKLKCSDKEIKFATPQLDLSSKSDLTLKTVSRNKTDERKVNAKGILTKIFNFLFKNWFNVKNYNFFCFI